MKTRAMLKEEAKQTLSGNFWKTIGLFLIFPVMLLMISLIFFALFGIGFILKDFNELLATVLVMISMFIIIVISLLIQFSFSGSIMLVTQKWYKDTILEHKEKAFHPFKDVIDHMKKYGKGIIFIGLLQLVFSFLWSLLFIIPGIIKSFSYSQSLYIYREKVDAGETNISYLDCITESRQRMKGHKWELFVLILSFIGWLLLSYITLGLANLWIVPYMMTTLAAYSQSLKEECR